MNALNFLDANVWLALIWSRHEHSTTAREWFERSLEEQLFYCRFAQLTVLRLLTTKIVMGEDVCTMAEAWELWDKVSADPHIALLAEPENLEPELRANSSSASMSPKMWADAYLLSFASVAGLKLVTFDRALRSRRTEVLVLGDL